MDDPSGPPSGTRRLLRSAAVTVVGLVVIGLVRAAARIGANAAFGAEGLAYVTAALAVATVVTIVGAGGLSAGTTKFIAELRGRSDATPSSRFTTLSARVGVIFSLLGLAVAWLWAALDPVLSRGGTALAATTGLLAFTFGLYLTGKAIAYGEDDAVGYVRSEMLGAAAFVALGVVVVVGDADSALLLPLVLAYLGVGLIGIRRLPGRVKPTLDLPIGPYAGYGVVGAIGAAAGVGFTYATALVAGFSAGVLGAALIGAVLTVLEPLYLAPRAIGLVLLPRISSLTAAHRNDEASRALTTATKGVGVLVTPIIAVLILERGRILQLLFGAEVVGEATLGWFAAAAFVSIVGAPAVTALAATDLRRATIPMVSSVVGVVLAIIVWVAAVSEHGTVAVAFGYLVGSVAQVTPPLVVSHFRYRPRWQGFWIRLGAAMLLVAVAASLDPSIFIDVAVAASTLVLLLPEVRLLLGSVATRRG